MPRVTVLIPTFQSAEFIREAIDSVLAQTYRDYEILIIDDGSTDGTVGILDGYNLPAIRVLAGPEKGLAEALNMGLREAKGEYIARLDSDDTMVPDRLEKQTAYMDSHPGVIVLGGWQQCFGNSTYLHAPPSEPEQCKANLLFRCDLCHSTLMLRKSVFLDNNLFYCGEYGAEDFELWTRALNFGDIANLGEILGFYRATGDNSTVHKKRKLIYEHSSIVAKTLQNNLDITLTDRQKKYFIGWVNPFFDPRYGIKWDKRPKEWEELRRVLWGIYERNRSVKYYDDTALLRMLYAEWGVLRYNEPFIMPNKEITTDNLFEKRSLGEVLLRKYKSFSRNNRGLRRKVLKLRSVIKGE